VTRQGTTTNIRFIAYTHTHTHTHTHTQTNSQPENEMSTENEARKDLSSKHLHFCTHSKMAAFLISHLFKKKAQVCRKTDWRMREIQQLKLHDKGAKSNEIKRGERKKERKKK